MSIPGPRWQKSSFSGDASNCINVAATGDGSLLLRESDAPDTVITLSATALCALLRALAR
ncbi:hypothetical protein GCM10010218_29050 [Streptomyces mashuensis]|uniref:DUF397 domain-containing protein n=1 Tax=Streptomyces mashuensis TaxID=33904 RepID=A0A919B2H5_9ACTN|nr:DUF397 domain-containing protein [Streptomyces mashuensis]GHF46004.1 hypothetical protein GCM10010218_29050 [Streptomyces mashuensis]